MVPVTLNTLTLITISALVFRRYLLWNNWCIPFTMLSYVLCFTLQSGFMPSLFDLLSRCHILKGHHLFRVTAGEEGGMKSLYHHCSQRKVLNRLCSGLCDLFTTFFRPLWHFYNCLQWPDKDYFEIVLHLQVQIALCLKYRYDIIWVMMSSMMSYLLFTSVTKGGWRLCCQPCLSVCLL